MEWYEPEIRALERRQRERPAPRGAVAFYGSSSITLWTTLAEDFPGCPVINLGFGGSTLAACSWFFSRVVPPVAPASLILYAGDNDIGDGKSPREILSHFDHLQRQLDASLPGIVFGWISIKPSPARFAAADRIRAVNIAVRERLAVRPRSVYVDVYGPMLDEARRPRPELYQPDGLHLSRAGYLLWIEVLSTHAKELQLERPSP